MMILKVDFLMNNKKKRIFLKKNLRNNFIRHQFSYIKKLDMIKLWRIFLSKNIYSFFLIPLILKNWCISISIKDFKYII